MIEDKLRRFIQSTRERPAVAPGGDGGQCVDLVELWMLALGASRTWANAVGLLDVAPRSEWLVTLNTPLNYPPEGAIVVWGPWAPFGIGSMGHCAIVRWADVVKLDVYQQNYPNGARAGYGGFPNYGGVLGWMVRRGAKQLA